MRTIALLALLTLLVTPAFAQKQKPKKSAESGAEKKQENSQPAPATSATAQKDDDEDKGPWKGLSYRLIGPFRGGRVLAVSGVVGQDNTYYFGGVAGGVWKTTDGGLNWKPLFDKQKDASPSIGAIAVSETAECSAIGAEGSEAVAVHAAVVREVSDGSQRAEGIGTSDGSL